MIPPFLAQQISDSQERFSTTLLKKPVEVGDIRTLSYGGVTRLILVLEVDASAAMARFQLLHSSVEFATEFDLLLSTSITGLAFDVLVETDLESVVHTFAVGECLATVPEVVVGACQGESGLESDGDTLFSGPPLRSPLDARWHFKIEEGDFVRNATHDSLTSFLDDPLFWTFEFDEILNAMQEPVEDAAELAAKVLDAWSVEQETFVLSITDVENLWTRGLLDGPRWSESLGPVGLLFFDSVLLPMIESARRMSELVDVDVKIVTLDAVRELELV